MRLNQPPEPRRRSLVDVDVRPRTGIMVVGIVLVAWAACAWHMLRPDEISVDWHGWRQTDTQTIALNFMKPDAHILSPQINWGGDGPGYVETEFQLYTRTVALLMRFVGTGEWIGQLVSLLAVVAAALLVFLHLSRHHRPTAALVGFGVFLAARTTPHLATVVMPDALALLGYVAAWTYFSKYAQRGRTSDLLVYRVAGALAMLVKPTTAHLGISSFLLLALSRRARLRDYRVWLTWLSMVTVLAVYLVNAHRLYTEYGNTFGLLFGEDSKAPSLKLLLMPRPWLSAVRFGVTWALGFGALAALLVQALRRSLNAEHIALGVGNALVVVVALRYMSDGAGVHYFAPAALLGACAAASFTEDALQMRHRSIAMAVIALVVVGEGYRSMRIRYFNAHYYKDEVAGADVVATGKEVDHLTNPGDLIVVRSPNRAFDLYWQQAANYHDPRIFYLSGTHGWTLGSEQEDVNLLDQAMDRGARFLADPLAEHSAVIDTWLKAHGELVWSQVGGRIWKLHTPSHAGSEARPGSAVQPPAAGPGATLATVQP